ncbi:MAG: hypothetical protein Q8L47_03955 [bacterium]|nr:hypothetical protein [bacterium]
MIHNKNLKWFLFISLLVFLPTIALAEIGKPKFWQVQSIDTVKYSRDLAREKMEDAKFDAVIEKQMAQIASTGATHVALGTPYDKEFLPFLKRWVASARKHNLKVWFRGNWSGWEGWFEYPIITRDEHISKTENFILDNGNLFQDGDIFTACPECENGGLGDPRNNGDVTGHRNFLIKEHKVMESAFRKIGKKVIYNFNSMNGDVARLIMDKKTTTALGGVVTIDHYVRTPEKLALDIQEISKQSGGVIVLGETGVPIPDIHGRITDEAQAKWMKDALGYLTKMPEVIGVNYWLSYGGATSLWRDNGTPKPIVDTLKSYYTPKVFSGYIMDTLNKPIALAKIRSGSASATSLANGYFEIPYVPENESIYLSITAEGYVSKVITTYDLNNKIEIQLEKSKEGFWFRTLKFIRNLFSFVF